MEVPKERILSILKSKGIDMKELASNPVIYERACVIAYKVIPIPWRWFVGRKRARMLVNMAIRAVNGG